MMNIRAIRNEEDYSWALAEVEQYFDLEPEDGSPEAERFDVLSTLIEAYESKHWPIEAADPVETLRAVMEARGFSQSDLADLLGSRSRSSEVLNRKRELTKEQVWVIFHKWNVPAELLIRPYLPAPASRSRAKRVAA